MTILLGGAAGCSVFFERDVVPIVT